MYRTILDEIGEQMSEAGRQLQPPCPARSLEYLAGMVRAVFACPLPASYAEFLGGTDGLEWNGLMIYASATTPVSGSEQASIQGFVEANLLWRDYQPNEDFLIFGESGLSKYVYNLARSEYQIMDRPSFA